MDHTGNIALGAEISKINILLEHLYAMVLASRGATEQDIPDISAQILLQMNAIPRVHGSKDDALIEPIHDLARQRVATFMAGVARRLPRPAG